MSGFENAFVWWWWAREKECSHHRRLTTHRPLPRPPPRSYHENVENRTRQPLIFFLIYVPYLIFPALVVARVWKDAPFSAPLPKATEGAIRALAYATYALFVGAGVAWAFRCEIGDAAKAACRTAQPLAETVPHVLELAVRNIFGVVYVAVLAALANWVYRQGEAAGSKAKTA